MKKNDTLLELLIGIFFVGVVSQIVCLVFFEQRLYNAIGLWAGIFIASGMVIHMQRTIEDGLDLMGDVGVKHMKKGYMTRTFIAIIAMAVLIYYNWGNPITLLVGVTTLKLAVYMQPLVHKVRERRREGGETRG